MKENTLETLVGKSITNWIVCELALIPDEDGKSSTWTSELISYRQFYKVEINCDDGASYQIESIIDDDGYYELTPMLGIKALELYEPKGEEFIRVVELNFLPKGKVDSVQFRLDENKRAVALDLEVSGEMIELKSGFIAQKGEKLVVCCPEEFVIINAMQ